VSCACQNGHDEALEVLFELGACVNETALPAAIRSGSLRCAECLLERKVKVDSEVLELATACGHGDILGRLLRVCTGFGNSWLIARLDGFGDGQRLLETAGAISLWTGSGRFLTEGPGMAAACTGAVTLPETTVGAAEWEIAEFEAVVARLLRDGTATARVMRALLERKWDSRAGTFARCWAASFASFVSPHLT
jgi:hypothetical protein